MSFIKKFIEAETVSRRNFLLASAYGITGAAAMKMLGPNSLGPACRAASLWQTEVWALSTASPQSLANAQPPHTAHCAGGCWRQHCCKTDHGSNQTARSKIA